MSQPGTRLQGPRESRITWLWDQIWSAYRAGQVYEYYQAQADVDIAEHRRTLPPNDIAASNDLALAETVHLSQSAHFSAALTSDEKARQQLNEAKSILASQAQKLSLFVVQSLALANGSVVLGTLGYLSKDNPSSNPGAFVVVIIVGGIGFLLTLLAAHLSNLMVNKPLSILSDLGTARLSEAQITKLKGDLMPSMLRVQRTTRPLGYAAAACLVLALTVGALSLGVSRPAVAAPPSATGHQSSNQKCIDLSEHCLTVRQTEAAERQAVASEQEARVNAEGQSLAAFATIASGISAVLSLVAIILSGYTAFKTAKDSRAQMRAYVSTENGNAASSNHPNGDITYEFEVRFKNSGATPATDFRHLLIVSFEPNPLPANFIFGVPFPPGHTVSAIGAQQVSSLRASVVVPAARASEVIQNSAGNKLYAFGRCDYLDIYGARHITQFAYRISIVNGLAVWESLAVNNRVT